MDQYLDREWSSETAVNLGNGDFATQLSTFLSYIVSENIPIANTEEWESALESYVKSFDENLQEEVLICLGISMLVAFIQNEWTGPDLQEVQKLIDGFRPNADALTSITQQLLVDNDSIASVPNIHILFYSIQTFEVCCRKFANSFWSLIWLIRSIFIQQQLLDDCSAHINNRLTKLLQDAGTNLPKSLNPIFFYLEYARIELYYGFIETADELLNKAAKLAGITHYFTGALGKRTKFQQEDIPQLIMKVKVNDSSEEPNNSAQPKYVNLQDEVRLEEVKLAEPCENDISELSSCDVAILLGNLMLRKKGMAQDELAAEEHRAAIERMLRGAGSWPVQLSILLIRSQIEGSSRRTVERSMMQVQAVLDDIHGHTPSLKEKLNQFFISYLPSKRKIELMLADLLISLGAVKSALDIALRLEEWETAVLCYNALDLRHKAKELIEQQLNSKETPKLWCLLGDATDDVKCYEKAWDLSNHKSARAQRCWANFLYQRKQYGESIEHYEVSLSINSLQTNCWFRLGFAALHEENWPLSANAYRRYCVLDNECFEAWNNMARCYCELKQHRRAWRALQEALKIDHTNWRVWDNFMLVSAHLGELHEVIRSYHEVLNLKNSKHIDIPVLRSLVGGYNKLSDQIVRDGLVKKILELFGRLTSQVVNDSDIWALYAEVLCQDKSIESYRKQRDLLLKAHRAAVGKPGWEMTEVSCQRVLAILERLLSVTILSESELSVAAIRMAANASVTIITRSYPDTNICSNVMEKLIELDKIH